MPLELKVPELGESIAEVEIGDWLKQPGEPVRKDEPLVALESEKATVELPAPESGTLTRVLKTKGEVAKIGETIGVLEPGAVRPAPAKPSPPTSARKTPAPAVPRQPSAEPAGEAAEPRVMPAAQAALEEHGLRAEDV